MNIYSLYPETITGSAPVLLGRKARHRLLRRADIIQAAEHVFALKGFDQATIKDIAAQAQYAVGTVYLYFKDKDALYFSIVEEKLGHLLDILRLKTGEVKGARKKLEVLVYESLSFFEKNQDFFRISVQEGSRWTVKSRFARSAVARKRKDFLSELIRQAQSEGLIRKDTAPGQICEMLESIVTSFIFSWWLDQPRQGKDLTGMTSLIMDLFFNGAKG